MNLTENEFKQLTYISAGTFGAVSHNDTTAFKRYHTLVKTHSDFGYQLISNPCLKPHPIKFQLVKYLNKKLRYTDLNYERLYIDQKFCGICYPYYEGKILYELQQLPFIEKENIVKQLLRNAEELSTNNIYPLDYKLDNIIYTNTGQVKIIDLDDPLTKYRFIKHPNLFNESMITLTNTIIHFLNSNYNHSYYFLSKYLTHKKQIHDLRESITYQKLNDYLNIHRLNNCFLIIQPMDFSYKDISFIKAMINKLDVKVIVLDSQSISFETLEQFIIHLNQEGISIFDVIPESNHIFDNYINNYNTSEYYWLDHNKNISKQKIKSR